MRDVRLAVLAEVRPVPFDDCRGVVEEAVVFFLEDRHDQHHLRLLGEVHHRLRRLTVGDQLSDSEVLVILDLAEVRTVEEFLEAQHFGALLSRLTCVVGVLLDHGVDVSGPLRLDDRRPYDVCHAVLLWLRRLVVRAFHARESAAVVHLKPSARRG